MTTGTSLSIVTENNSQSYNTAVNTINLHQKDSVRKLENALHNANNNNAALLASLEVINNNIKNCKKQFFINNALIVNWNKDAPFIYNIELLD